MNLLVNFNLSLGTSFKVIGESVTFNGLRFFVQRVNGDESDDSTFTLYVASLDSASLCWAFL